MDYAALKSECQTDPTGLGLATPFAAVHTSSCTCGRGHLRTR